MPGFSLVLNTENPISQDKRGLIQDVIKGNGYQINRFTVPKFLDDKLFLEREEFILVLDGAILNKRELLKDNNCGSLDNLIEKLYKEDLYFYKRFRGTFSGLIFDKKKQEWNIFVDHLGSKPLYYYRNGNTLVLSSEMSDIFMFLRHREIKYDLDIEAAYMLLSYGYMLDDHTLCTQIKKLGPGQMMKVISGEITISSYYKLPQAPLSTELVANDLVDTIDEKFRIAVKRQFEKDLEYGYLHFVALSGGLDSRMTAWVAHQMGYTDQLNFTFSQSDYLDETIPKKIAADLHHEWIFKALDNGIFLKDIDEITKISGGNALYYGLAHGNSLLKYLDFNNLGMVHTGQLGDVVISSFIKSTDENILHKLDGAYSKRFSSQTDSNLTSTIEAKELELMYGRAINGANVGLLIAQQSTETMSPFYDIDFLEFCLSIPVRERMGHKLYIKWVLEKYPGAGRYVWESTGKPLNKSEVRIKIKGRSVPIDKLPGLFYRKMGFGYPKIATKHHMNPLEYWYNTNPDIKRFQDNYFEQNQIKAAAWPELQKEIITRYKAGGAIEKNQVLSLLAALKLFM